MQYLDRLVPCRFEKHKNLCILRKLMMESPLMQRSKLPHPLWHYFLFSVWSGVWQEQSHWGITVHIHGRPSGWSVGVWADGWQVTYKIGNELQLKPDWDSNCVRAVFGNRVNEILFCDVFTLHCTSAPNPIAYPDIIKYGTATKHIENYIKIKIIQQFMILTACRRKLFRSLVVLVWMFLNPLPDGSRGNRSWEGSMVLLEARGGDAAWRRAAGMREFMFEKKCLTANYYYCCFCVGLVDASWSSSRSFSYCCLVSLLLSHPTSMSTSFSNSQVAWQFLASWVMHLS